MIVHLYHNLYTMSSKFNLLKLSILLSKKKEKFLFRYVSYVPFCMFFTISV